MVHHFADRLTAAVRRTKTPALVGIDPRLANLPAPLQPNDDSPSPEQIATAFLEFSHGIIDVVAPLVPAVKPQSAFFEQIGPAGTAALGEVIQYARSKGLVVITDAKRNDIGSTAAAYAQAYLGPMASTPFSSDCLTVSPYLGEDSLEPFVEVAQQNGNGIFVLVKTSNPGGGRFQDLVADGQPVYQHVAQLVNQLALNTPGQDSSHSYGCVGAVVGATYPEQLVALRQSMPNTWLLVPGYGAQGGGASDVAGGFDEQGLGAIINSSRGIIFAHDRDEFRDTFSPLNWQRAVEAATLDMIAGLAAETPAGKLQAAS
ncbi:MAG: orotidine-5'-phosphate decarboxylase [Planctomycetaceae bacterium]|jgi:orotidine-5'-phosphate decarboxylase|nr:orotidine-5'-phosphate decarboxylase [Planctomycetaceae bacterium]